MIKTRLFPLLSAAALALLTACTSTPPQAPPSEPLRVKLLALNDFHGNLKPPAGGIRIKDPADPTQRINVPAGGVEHMATLLAQLRAQNPNHAFVAAGDLVGASPLLSSLFRDEPTIEAFNLMGLDASAMGNHELDRGQPDLLRLQAGGCHPVDGCKGPAPYGGAKFPYLAANTVVQATGKTLFPPYFVKTFEGIPVAFIGLTLKGTPNMVVPSGTRGLRFDDEADSVNALVPELQMQGIEAIVVLIHEGGLPSGDYNECPGLSGPMETIVRRMSKAVDVVISGHTHTAYNCIIDGRPVTSAHRYGTLVTQIDLTIDRRTRDVTSARAENLIVDIAKLAPDPRLSELVATYERLVRPLAQRPVTRLAAPFSLSVDEASGETELGRLIADAQLAATREQGAQLAMMNRGGVRAPLGSQGRLDIVYEDVFTVQPFYNQLVTLTFSGAQLLQMLEQQVSSQRAEPMYVSRGFSYTWDSRRPSGQRVLAETVRLDGRPVTPEQRIRVTMNNFVAEGGDGYSVARQGTERSPGPIDSDALEAYLKANPGLAPDRQPRITKLK